MKTPLPALLALLLLLSACNSDRDSTGNAPPVSGGSGTGCERSSWIAGTTELCNGRLIYRDYVYDDYGADLGFVSPPGTLLNLTTRMGPGQTQPGPLSPSAGDKQYPAGLENTADLVRVELAIEGNELVASFELNTLYNPDETIAALAIDTDNNAATGGGSWEGLGISSTGWDVLQKFSTGNPETNKIVGRMPLPGGETWRVQAVVAQKNGTVMNVAFRGPDEQAGATGAIPDQVLPDKGNFWEDKQAAALASGDISVFGETVKVADLKSGATRAATVAPGLHQRVYTSAYTLPPGEGVNLAGVPGRHGDTGSPCEQLFHYLGKYQPYAIYIPDTARPHGVQLYLHGCSANHASQLNQPGFQQQFGEGLNRILIGALGRGPTGFYSDISERDVLDVLADAQANYDTDADRVFISGYSMGGYGTLRLGALYPDLFAGAVNWVGFTGSIFNTPLPGNPQATNETQFPNPTGLSGEVGGIGNVYDFVRNFRHVPIANLYMGEDELVQVTTALAMQQAFEAVEVPYKLFLHPVGDHLTLIALDDWQKEADYSKDLARVTNPARVTYRTDASFAYPEYALKHDRAYWVSEIVANGEGYSDVDLTSLGCAIPQPQFESGQDAGTSPLPWVATFRKHPDAVILIAPEPEFKLKGALRNVKSLTVDADATCLRGHDVAFDLDLDGPVTIRLSDGRSFSLQPALNSIN